MQGSSEPYPSASSLEVRRGRRHTVDAVPGHCTLQARLRLHDTASNTNLWQLDSTHNSELRLTLGDFCTSPISCMYTEYTIKLLWGNVGQSYPCITIWKLVPALTIQHIMPCMNLTKRLETIAETYIVELLREVGLFCLLLTVRHSIQFLTLITPNLMQFVNLN